MRATSFALLTHLARLPAWVRWGCLQTRKVWQSIFLPRFAVMNKIRFLFSTTQSSLSGLWRKWELNFLRCCLAQACFQMTGSAMSKVFDPLMQQDPLWPCLKKGSPWNEFKMTDYLSKPICFTPGRIFGHCRQIRQYRDVPALALPDWR